jgi:hypothetical protein
VSTSAGTGTCAAAVNHATAGSPHCSLSPLLVGDRDSCEAKLTIQAADGETVLKGTVHKDGVRRCMDVLADDSDSSD